MENIPVVCRFHQLHRGIDPAPKWKVVKEKPERGQRQNRGRMPADAREYFGGKRRKSKDRAIRCEPISNQHKLFLAKTVR